jgi:hypothetical protein
LEAATEIRPSPGWMAETPGTSVMVRTERSRPVTVALPPRRTRTNERSPVAIRSRRETWSFEVQRLRRNSVMRAECDRSTQTRRSKERSIGFPSVRLELRFG